ncbi:MAG: glycosyltransferase family 2 protein [Candidatus Omnitrophica bacterium]|nr:glycosyltransferase family 2 protein [Candidatus Omnitrophota bacterium]
MEKERIKRILEIIPGTLSWSIIFGFLGLLVFKPLVSAIVLIVYLMFWTCRLLYMSTLLVMAHHRMMTKKNMVWLSLCKGVASDKKFEDIVHVVLYTVYKEPGELIEESLASLGKINYPKDKVIVVLAGEERDPYSRSKLEKAGEKIKGTFRDVIITTHPKDIEGEIPCKGANATFSAKQVKIYLEGKNCDTDNVVLSCFDADTCPDKNYFACLTYHFLNNPKRHQTSFQPLPIYSNNIYRVPAFARVIEMGSTFWQLIESMRYEKFVTFSSHSMSFKTLVEVDYWPVDLVSDDSLIFWKCFLKYNGEYKTYSLEVPVYMDIAVGKNIFHTVAVQYKQKRRWAWGVETFAFMGMRLLGNKDISFGVKFRKMFQILDSHINWATWGIIISFITPLFLFWGRNAREDLLVFCNLSYINGTIFNSLTFTLILCIIISREFLPPKPKEVSRLVYFSIALQWLCIPFVSATLGSFPALDAQTRLMFKKKLGFYPTPKGKQ